MKPSQLEMGAALTALRMPGIKGALEKLLSDAHTRKLSHRDFLYEICRLELDNRTTRREVMHTKIARFPYLRDLDGFDFSSCPSIAEEKIRDLAECHFITGNQNILFLGPPGTGKTHLAVSLGRTAIREGHTVLFCSASALVADLLRAQSMGGLEERIAWYAKPRLLVVDELGYLRFEKQAADVLFQLVSRRYERSSMILTSNRPVNEWGEVLGDSVVATAVLDRLLHHSHVFLLRGESYRLRDKRKGSSTRLQPAEPNSSSDERPAGRG